MKHRRAKRSLCTCANLPVPTSARVHWPALNRTDPYRRGILRTDGTVDHKDAMVDLKANDMIKQVEENVNLVCIFGGTRSGKSVSFLHGSGPQDP